MQHRAFDFKTFDELRAAVKEMDLGIEFSEDLSPLAEKVRVGTKETPNAFAVLPMEGCDSAPDGSPTEPVRRRYRRFAGTAECTVCPLGRKSGQCAGRYGTAWQL